MLKSTEDRFYSKVNKTENCWEWTAGKDWDGYGRFNINGKIKLAHRVAWFLAYGEIPDNICVLHHCDNPSCVKIDHLFLGTDADNVKDKILKGRDLYAFGEDHGMRKLDWEKVKEIRRLHSEGNLTQAKIASIFDVSPQLISNIVLNKNWRQNRMDSISDSFNSYLDKTC